MSNISRTYNLKLRVLTLFILIPFATIAVAQGIVPHGFDLSALTVNAERGDPIAQYRLAEAYRNGNGVSEDVPKAFDLYRKSAANGYAPAQYAVGVMYSDGSSGLPENDREAFKWFLMAAEQHHLEAEIALGSFYDVGNGVSADEVQSMHWYTEAANQGDAKSQLIVGVNFLEGTGVAKNLKKGAEWISKAAGQGNLEAMRKMHELYTDGIGVKKDAKLARMWARKADDTADVLEKAD